MQSDATLLLLLLLLLLFSNFGFRSFLIFLDSFLRPSPENWAVFEAFKLEVRAQADGMGEGAGAGGEGGAGRAKEGKREAKREGERAREGRERRRDAFRDILTYFLGLGWARHSMLQSLYSWVTRGPAMGIITSRAPPSHEPIQNTPFNFGPALSLFSARYLPPHRRHVMHSTLCHSNHP